MTDERPADRLTRKSEAQLREWGIDPEQVRLAAAEKEAQRDAEREATRKELRLDPPEPHPRQMVTIQTPGGGVQYVNTRARETEAQREARLEQEKKGQTMEPENQPEPPSQAKAPEQGKKIDLEREILPPWETDPRGS